MVEIVIAIGILGVAILPVIGLMGMGVSQSGTTIRNAVMAQILNQVNAEIRQISFDQIAGISNNDPLYFDDEGVSSPAGEAQWKVTFQVTNALFPGTTNSVASPLDKALLVKVVTDFVPGGGAAVQAWSQTNFLYVNDRGK